MPLEQNIRKLVPEEMWRLFSSLAAPENALGVDVDFDSSLAVRMEFGQSGNRSMRINAIGPLADNQSPIVTDGTARQERVFCETPDDIFGTIKSHR